MGCSSSKKATKLVVIALNDYKSGSRKELNLRTNEQLTVLDKKSNRHWWFVHSHRTGKNGWIPSNYVAPVNSILAEPWYFGQLSRAKSEKALMHPFNKSGAYIVRDSDRYPGQFALSLLDGGTVKQYRIQTTEQGAFYLNESVAFRTLKQLVQHHTLSADGLCRSLGQPCLKSGTPKTCGLAKGVWEIPRKELKLTEVLGEGQFAEVFKGVWKKTKPVAVKVLKHDSLISEAELKQFLLEAQIMKELGHNHLVQLYGVCSRYQPVYIVTELMKNGALLDYLHSIAGKELTVLQLINMGAQVAEGMAYLEERNYIHRDLAARNILLDDKLDAKIADFGMARAIPDNIYMARGDSLFPIKWTAPEALLLSMFSIKSDVWSFGILLTELVTYGETPYPGLTKDEVRQRLEDDPNFHMARPQNCPEILYDIMLKCWASDPEKRPKFSNLQFELEELISNGAGYEDLL